MASESKANRGGVAPWRKVFEQAARSESGEPEPSNRITVPASLCTVEKSKYPRARAVMCRGFVGDYGLEMEGNNRSCGDLLVVNSHLKSPKIEQLLENPNSELLFYFPKTGQQFRFACKTLVLSYKTLDFLKTDLDLNVVDFLYEKPRAVASDSKESKRLETFKPEFDKRFLLESSFSKFSANLAGWFAGPPPGTDLSSSNIQDTAEKLEELSEEELISRAKENYVLLIFFPSSVDCVNLGAGDDKRLLYKLQDDNTWSVSSIVP
ncbi:hypothetical protein BB560_004371 [Smittium megazygosporum]|uniref:Pyridoxamine 5'-phosphate oxidase Alr4036 family FMN-binding domain-containing protein n=1 Tax=Smittium megazygosporum TaxID=133381 RepID=A0A2T9Z9E9_9FUNG|nr:hypothetical protein BB560_004371 [Smittium megazygosporum]